MKRKLVICAAMVDTEDVDVLSPLTFIDGESKPNGKMKLNRTVIPVITFETPELPNAQALLAKLVEVDGYSTSQDSPILAIANQNIMLVEPSVKKSDEDAS